MPEVDELEMTASVGEILAARGRSAVAAPASTARIRRSSGRGTGRRVTTRITRRTSGPTSNLVKGY